MTGHRAALTPFKFQPAFDNFDEEKLVSSNGSDIVIKMSPMLQTYDNESLVLQRVDQVRVSNRFFSFLISSIRSFFSFFPFQSRVDINYRI